MGNDEGDEKPIQLRWTVAGCVVAVGLMVLAGLWGAPRSIQSPLDRIFYWSFVVFAVGLAELFVLLIVLTILGRLDLTQVFRDKEHLKLSAKAETLKQATVSLSRLQAFLWTLVVMTVFFHSAATHPADGIPTVPPEILLLMGISGAVYLAGKHLSVQHSVPAAKTDDPAAGGDK